MTNKILEKFLQRKDEKKANERKQVSTQMKIRVLTRAMATFFAEHDELQEDVNLSPSTRAFNEVQKFINEGTLDFKYEWYLLQQEYLRKITALQEKYMKKKLMMK